MSDTENMEPRNYDHIFKGPIAGTHFRITGDMPITMPITAVDDGSGVWTMTDTEFQESLRKAKEEAWEEGWHGGAGWPQSEANPYRMKR